MRQYSTTDRPYHHGALREAALEAGRALLAEGGEDDLSLRGIARVVGVSSMAVYRHFPNKAEFLRALATEGIERLAKAQREANDASGGGRDGVLAMGEAYVGFAAANPRLFRLIYSHPPQHDPMDRAWGGISTAMAQLLDTAPLVAPCGADVAAFALHHWAVVHGLAMLVLDGQVPNDPVRIRASLSAYDLASRS